MQLKRCKKDTIRVEIDDETETNNAPFVPFAPIRFGFHALLSIEISFAYLELNFNSSNFNCN